MSTPGSGVSNLHVGNKRDHVMEKRSTPRIKFPIVLIMNLIGLGVIFSFSGGCASDYSARDDLSPGQVIGLVIPVDIVESMNAEDFIQLFDSSVAEDRLKNSGVGAGKGAAIGTVTGVGLGALIGCAATGPFAPVCWAAAIAPAVAIGTGAGAVQGADKDTRERVEVAPAHVYKVNRVLPDWQHDYLSKADLERRAIRLVQLKFPDVKFNPAEPDGDRYRFVANNTAETKYSDINLVLTGLSIRLEGKRDDEPKVMLLVDATWLFTNNHPSMTTDIQNETFEGHYQSERFLLSEWLDEDGELLKDQINNGIESTFNSAFAALAIIEDETRAGISPVDSF